MKMDKEVATVTICVLGAFLMGLASGETGIGWVVVSWLLGLTE